MATKDSTGLRVRRAGAKDAPLVAPLVDALSLSRTDDPPRLSRRALSRQLAEEGSPVFIAMEGGRALGLVRFHLLSALAHNGRRWAMLEDLIVADDARAGGVGDALLRAAVSAARRLGCYKISLASRANRRSAHKLYRKAGFERFGYGFRLLL